MARGSHSGDAGTFTLLLAAMGGGAIVAALSISRLRGRVGRDQFVVLGTVVNPVP